MCFLRYFLDESSINLGSIYSNTRENKTKNKKLGTQYNDG